MFRVVLMGGKAYSLSISSIEDDMENLEEFVSQGTAVILTDDLQELEKLGINPDDVIDADDDMEES